MAKPREAEDPTQDLREAIDAFRANVVEIEKRVYALERRLGGAPHQEHGTFVLSDEPPAPLPPVHVPEIGSTRNGVFVDGPAEGRRVADVEADVAVGKVEITRDGPSFVLRVVAVLLLAIAGAFPLAGCSLLNQLSPVAEGSREKVVRTEQALKLADFAYREAMQFYFAPGRVATMSREVVIAFDALRVGFDPAYKAVQAALDVYKRGGADTLDMAFEALRSLLNSVLAHVLAAGPGPPPPRDIPALWEFGRS